MLAKITFILIMLFTTYYLPIIIFGIYIGVHFSKFSKLISIIIMSFSLLFYISVPLFYETVILSSLEAFLNNIIVIVLLGWILIYYGWGENE